MVSDEVYEVGKQYRDRGKPGEPDDQFMRWLNMPGSGMANSPGIRPLNYVGKGGFTDLPSVLILVTRTKKGPSRNPWKDDIDLDAQTIFYWGDAKADPVKGLLDFNGNKILRRVNEAVETKRRDEAPPILHFTKAASGWVTFNGLCVLDGLDQRTFQDEGQTVENYLCDLRVLEEPTVAVGWLRDRRSASSPAEALDAAPDSWRAWVEGGRPKLKTVGALEQIRQNIRVFNTGARSHPARAASLLAQTTYWVFDPETTLFGPSKFCGYEGMTFARYEAAGREELGGSSFDGTTSRRAIERVLGREFDESPISHATLVSWAEGIAADRRGEVRESKWRFVTAGEAPQAAYVCRICWNSSGWLHPTGEAVELESDKNYVPTHWFGHEEWLFNLSWQLDGWKYAYVQPAMKSREKLEGQRITLLLYAIDPAKERVYIGRVENCEVLSESQADAALAAFKGRGWLDQMIEEVEEVEGTTEMLSSPGSSTEVFNIRFRPRDLQLNSPPYPTAKSTDYVRVKTSRYQLEEVSGDVVGQWTRPVRKTGTTKKRPTKPGTRSGTRQTTFDLNHNRLQNHLFDLLRKRYCKDSVLMEVQGVDILVDHPDLLAFIELKSSADARLAVREALGQVLEYAYLRPGADGRDPVLVVAAPGPMTSVVSAYLDLLKVKFGLDVTYLEVSLEMTELPALDAGSTRS